jgi:hypothetical protein
VQALVDLLLTMVKRIIWLLVMTRKSLLAPMPPTVAGLPPTVAGLPPAVA